MSPEIISRYFKEIESEVQKMENAYIERYEEEILTAHRANLRIRIRFVSGNLLELNEAVSVEDRNLKHLGYRYHFQDVKNNLVFRYDNAPHFPEIDSFPHHKHLPDTVRSLEKPSIIDVIKEVSDYEY